MPGSDDGHRAWVGFWEATAGVFELGWFVPVMIAICLVLMAVMLRRIRVRAAKMERG